MVCFATPLCPFLDQPANRPPGVTARPGSGRGHVRKIPKQPEDKDQNGGDHGPKWPGGVRGAGGHSWAPLRYVLLTGVSFLQTKSSRPDTSSASSCLLQAGYELRLVVPSAGRIRAPPRRASCRPERARARRQGQRRRWRDEERGRDDEGRGECEPKGSKGDARARVSQRATDAAEAGDSAGEAMGEGAITRAEASASPRAATETRE